jgi:transcription-repair coupling factor (superfamily II helicase)
VDVTSFLKQLEDKQLVRSFQKEISEQKRIFVKGFSGSAPALFLSALFDKTGKQQHLVVIPEKEEAVYFYNDLENLLSDNDVDYDKKKVLFYPTTYKRPYEPEISDKSYQLSRTEVLKRFVNPDRKTIVVTYPEALAEKVITKKYINKNTVKIKKGDEISQDFIIDYLMEYGFEQVDFVAEPGQFAIRGGIIDVFSFSNEHPYRIEFFGDSVESLRSFDTVSQLSTANHHSITVLPNIQDRNIKEERIDFLDYIPASTLLWLNEIPLIHMKIKKEFENAVSIFNSLSDETRLNPADLFVEGDDFVHKIERFKTIEWGQNAFFENSAFVKFNQTPQPSFNKNFDLLIKHLSDKYQEGFSNYIFSSNPKQIERLKVIFDDFRHWESEKTNSLFIPVNINLSKGFVDNDLKIVCYTDHELFERYYKFKLREGFGRKESLTIKQMYDLQPGDYITHIDHGVGRFDGLQVLDNNGKKQEVLRIIYKNGDILYVSIHSLHRISKFVGKDGAEPHLNKLGSGAWQRMKNRTKSRVKDIARDLIKLYAKRKAAKGFAFSPDTYMQTELEASFIYEDTPDQLKATQDVKRDMEKPYPMDRLVCGDVGFGKTEVAIRAAFKAVADSKQVAVLVPTTILALQHFKTFSDRLKDFPVTIDYINRFKSSKRQKETLLKTAEGKIDILIGTHRLLSKDVKFKDLGLYIIDEEQKFGVSAKEKLRQIRAEVDTLTLTATPIPRTLQFSLMGARDLSIINTPPPNRYPIQTEVRAFNPQAIREAILYEISRGGQVFFVHNRIQNIGDVHALLEKFVPGVRIAVAHGQMEGAKLEKIMLDFINGLYDVLLSTTIIESGLDIPNANTIIINDAQNYGLSDLHQLRGRVGRSNKKAFCYLLTPPVTSLTQDARKRLKAITDFADLGSGFNIAMRDLDIRGAGNILGAEQSGFISEIGMEMYHNILNEAVNELKESEFKELFASDKPKEFVTDTQLETDLEARIPTDYVSSITERLSLYKELNAIEEDSELTEFANRLKDRFGDIPPEVISIMDAVKLRRKAAKVGMEKIVLKMGNMSCYFTGDDKSDFVQSEQFGKILEYLKQNPKSVSLKEVNGKLVLRFQNVTTIEDALRKIEELL